MNNEEKNIDKRLLNLKPKMFTSEYQPTSKAKKKGWEKRRAKQEIMDMITKLRNISMKELKDLREDIKNNPDKHTVLEAKMAQYLSKEKFTIDFLDRNLGKAPQDIDITSEGEGVKKYILEFKDGEDKDRLHKDTEGTEEGRGEV